MFALLRAADEGLHAGRYGERSRQRLDGAFLSFLQSFRKVYVGEQVRGEAGRGGAGQGGAGGGVHCRCRGEEGLGGGCAGKALFSSCPLNRGREFVGIAITLVGHRTLAGAQDIGR